MENKGQKKRDSFFLTEKKDYKPKKEQNPKNPFKDKDNFKDKKRNQKEFDKNRKGLESEKSTDKKPFDKKTYRLKKYSKKYKLEQWEEQRKKKLLKNYYKDVKNDPNVGTYKPISFDEDTTDGQTVGRFVRHPDLIEKEIESEKTKKDPFFKAKEQYSKIKEEKLAKQQEIEKAKEVRKQKALEYKKKKQERFKKLSKKTKKGQPVMTGRLELLLDKLQKK